MTRSLYPAAIQKWSIPVPVVNPKKMHHLAFTTLQAIRSLEQVIATRVTKMKLNDFISAGAAEMEHKTGLVRPVPCYCKPL